VTVIGTHSNLATAAIRVVIIIMATTGADMVKTIMATQTVTDKSMVTANVPGMKNVPRGRTIHMAKPLRPKTISMVLRS
jgi:hypothetical protein